MDALVQDHFLLGLSAPEIKKAIGKKIKRKDVKTWYIEIIDALGPYFDRTRAARVFQATPLYYRLETGVLIPYKPTFCFSTVGASKETLPHFCYWRNNPLNLQQLSLFFGLMRRSLGSSRDLRDAAIEFVDCSAKNSKSSRQTTIKLEDEVPALRGAEIAEMTAIYSAALKAAEQDLRKSPKVEKPIIHGEKSVQWKLPLN